MMSRPQASKPQAQRSGGGAESLAKQATEEIEFRQNWGKMKLIGVLVKMQEYATKKGLLPNGNHQSPFETINDPTMLQLLSSHGIHEGMNPQEIISKKEAVLASFKA
jgi:hypothetical protein